MDEVGDTFGTNFDLGCFFAQQRSTRDISKACCSPWIMCLPVSQWLMFDCRCSVNGSSRVHFGFAVVLIARGEREEKLFITSKEQRPVRGDSESRYSTHLKPCVFFVV